MASNFIFQKAQDAQLGHRPIAARRQWIRNIMPQDVYRLISYHRTMLFLDTEARRLRHGPPGTVPQNLVLDVMGDRARLLAIDSDPAQSHQLHIINPQGQVQVSKEHSADFDLYVHRISDEVIGISDSVNVFLSSDPDGLVRNDRGHCRVWEQYTLQKVEDIAAGQVRPWVPDRPILFFIAVHKEAPLPPPCNHYVALGVGGYHPLTTMATLSDDVGNSIAVKNKHYSELTGWYWIWKNISNAEVIGLNHYRRYFLLDRNHPLFGEVTVYFPPEKHHFAYITSSEWNELLQQTLAKYDVVVPRRRRLSLPLSQQYISIHLREDWDLFIQGITALFPHKYSSQISWFDEECNIYPYNMMISSKEFFDSYMSKLFMILSWMEERRPFPMQAYECRVPAFIAERFFTFYLHVNQVYCAEVPVFVSERSAW